MSKVLGLDLGQIQLGGQLLIPIIIKSKVAEQKIFPGKAVRHKRIARQKRRNVFTIVNLLHFISFATVLLSLYDRTSWQFWLNLSLTTFVATLILLHQDKK
ncbi:MAG: hypothetical protein IPG30_13305 [Chitinophagaceae bacterium]|nr:hypothetical protein [Chitinophagaceae bacterium]